MDEKNLVSKTERKLKSNIDKNIIKVQSNQHFYKNESDFYRQNTDRYTLKDIKSEKIKSVHSL